MRWLRESYAGKLFAGLLGTVGVLLSVTYAVVRTETTRQVQFAAERATQNAASQLVQVEEMRQRQAARQAAPATEGRRMLALLEGALESGEVDLFAGEVVYQLALARLDDALLAFTDAAGRPFLTLRTPEADPIPGDDPARLSVAAETVLSGAADEVRSYRVLDGTLFGIRTQVIQLGGRAIGTISLGVPVLDEEVTGVGDAVGVEVCVVVEDVCVAGTPTARERLADRLVTLAGRGEAREVVALDATWSVRSQPLIASDPSQGSRVIAVPLDPVLAPFQRITGALLLGGGLALLLSLLVGVVLSRGLTRPVRALVAATTKVAEGDYETQVPVTTHDELGTLAESFNDMTRGLLLKERLRSILDVVSSREVAEELVRGGLQLGGENREVTVLFADIRGFSTLTEGMEPQGVIRLLNECMQRLSDAVVAEGGHVDKFVGDELMAVFNAPKSLEDHPGRALQAAVGMQAATESLNEERSARGEPPIALGIGVNTGTVVAGKMGSETRNNYTVLGETVNLASRLCSGAAAGEILTTARCLDRSERHFRVRSLGRRAFKGFSEPVEVVAVDDVETSPRPLSHRGSGTGALLLLLSLAVLPGSAGAQDWPTLRDLGGEYVSPGGRLQLTLSGQMELEGLAWGGPGPGLLRSVAEDGILLPRLRLFTDLFVGDRIYGLVELRGDRGDPPTAGGWDARIEQAFLRWAVDPGGRVAVQVGRFASPFGSYAGRHLSPGDPFLRAPLMYDYRTVMCPGIAPGTQTGFLTWLNRPDEFRDVGAPPIWGVPYQWGAMVAGTLGRLGYRVAAMNSAPSSDPEAWGWDGEALRHPSVVVGLGVNVSPSVSLGASYNRGPWMAELKRGAFPAGSDRWDYAQTLVSVDVTYARGPAMVRMEVMRDAWEVPNMAVAPVEIGGSVEAQVDLAAGFLVAARVGALDFRPVDTGGATVEWDHDARRYEASLGYRVNRNAGILASWAATPRRSSLEPRDTLFGVRWWWSF